MCIYVHYVGACETDTTEIPAYDSYAGYAYKQNCKYIGINLYTNNM